MDPSDTNSCDDFNIVVSTADEYSSVMATAEFEQMVLNGGVAGEVVVEWAEISDAQLVALTASIRKTYGPVILSGCTQLTTVTEAFALLAEVGGEFKIASCSSLQTIELPALTRTTESLTIRSNGAVTSVSAALLVSAGGVDIRSNKKIVSINFPALVSTASSLAISGQSALKSISLESLETVHGQLNPGDNGVLEELVLPRLREVGGRVYFANNYRLWRLVAPVWTKVGDYFALHDMRNLRDMCSVGLTNTSVAGRISISGTTVLTRGDVGFLTRQNEGDETLDPSRLTSECTRFDILVRTADEYSRVMASAEFAQMVLNGGVAGGHNHLRTPVAHLAPRQQVAHEGLSH